MFKHRPPPADNQIRWKPFSQKRFFDFHVFQQDEVPKRLCRRDAAVSQNDSIGLQLFNFMNPPAEFLCSTTLEIMKDPTVMSDGYTYERSAIRSALVQNPTPPLTRTPMKRVRPNPEELHQ
jgi:hypothetical protein